MSDLFVRLAELILKIGESNTDRPRSNIMGADYEVREERRSAIWVFAILVVLIGGGWLFFRWLLSFAK